MKSDIWSPSQVHEQLGSKFARRKSDASIGKKSPSGLYIARPAATAVRQKAQGWILDLVQAAKIVHWRLPHAAQPKWEPAVKRRQQCVCNRSEHLLAQHHQSKSCSIKQRSLKCQHIIPQGAVLCRHSVHGNMHTCHKSPEGPQQRVRPHRLELHWWQKEGPIPAGPGHRAQHDAHETSCEIKGRSWRQGAGVQP